MRRSFVSRLFAETYVYVSFGRSAFIAACVARQQAVPHDDQGSSGEPSWNPGLS
jgi:hypothetical protein